MKNYRRIVFTDLDGTLLDNKSILSKENREVLENLAKENILRVIVTGRSLYSVNKIIDKNFPVDYLVFSTGAGIMNWQTGEIINKKNIEINEVKHCSQLLIRKGVNFMLHQGIPESHLFSYYLDGEIPDDFSTRLDFYPGLSEPFDYTVHTEKTATQFLSMLTKEKFEPLFEEVRSELKELSVIKTTSPINGESFWLEIYAPDVNKGDGARALLDILNIDDYEAMAVGNDFNDRDLLEYFSSSYVVENAPEELKERYNTVASNDRNGFAEAVRDWMNGL